MALALALGVASGQELTELTPQPIPLLPAEAVWLTTLSAPPAAAGVMDGARVYVPQQDRQITALDRATGEILWMQPLDTKWPPVLGGGAVYVAAGRELHALDAETGTTRWHVPLERPLLGPMTFDSGWLLMVLEQGDVSAVRATDGKEIWRRRIGQVPRSAAVPGERGAVYYTFEDALVVALSLSDGRVLWEQRLGRNLLSEPAWGPGRVFVGSTDNYFYALDAGDGSIEWKWRYGGDVIGAAVDGDFVYVVSLDNVIRGMNRGNGNQRWRKDTGTRPTAAPQAFGRAVVVPGLSPTLTAFSGIDGAPIGTFPGTGALHGSPLLDRDPKPFGVGIVLVQRNGQVAGLSSVGLLFREQVTVPLLALPGRTLQREPAPPISEPR
jgi:outer membrane protein assembly factor BamB